MEFKKIILENGMTVLYEKRDVPVTTIVLLTKFGARYENEKEKGIAHFIEHLCFKGTKKRTTQDISSEIEKIGGNLNAFTHEEITAFHVKLPSNYLRIGMDVLFDIFFNPVFPEEEIKRESNVIVEEIRMYKDSPRHAVLDKIKESLYEKPFGIHIGGTENSVLSLRREEILNKHKKFYSPKNSVLVVVGNNSLEEIKKHVEELSVDSDFKDEQISVVLPKTDKYLEEREGIEQANIAIGFHIPFKTEKERVACQVFNAILGEGMSSKLFTEVRERRGLVYAVKSNLDIGNNYGYLVIYLGTNPTNTDEAIRVSLEEVDKMKFITEQELKDAKVQIIGNHRVSSEGSEETAINLAIEEILGDAQNYYNFEKTVNEITMEDIKKVINTNKHSLVILTPKKLEV